MRATPSPVIQANVDGHQINVLVDSGSDFSYIRENTAKRLNLPKIVSSPFPADGHQSIKLRLERYEKDRTIAELMTNVYVDDWLTSSDCEDELLGMMARSEEVLQQDSKIAQAWIRGDLCRWKQFVGNKVEEIQGATNPACWHHCPELENRADLLTRGVKASFLMRPKLWLHGAGETCSEISDEELDVSVSDELAVEKETMQNAMLVALSESPLIEYERFSKFEKLLRVTALIIRFVSILKSKAVVPGVLGST
ncbi:transposon tf2-6 polyprotein [Plakobranchus ocellatus]|uniref:Transposon tf2-6 polyprotein n=1 Tax=Plakobranchus ocellatus TaxID=259542 RepID=A0AAV4DR26_9GAST|nr:transposon tf2-6 polyprotein [Plakobranchus ocellatus]